MAIKISRYFLMVVLVFSGLIICLRAFSGPVRLILPINSPMNAESIFGLALAVSLALGCGKRAENSELPDDKGNYVIPGTPQSWERTLPARHFPRVKRRGDWETRGRGQLPSVSRVGMQDACAPRTGMQDACAPRTGTQDACAPSTDSRFLSAPASVCLALLLCLTTIAFWHSLFFPFLSDDYVLVAMGNSFSRENLLSVFTHAGGDGFFRPLGYVSLAWNAAGAHFNPISWHVSNLALHVANSLLVFALALALFADRWTALVASALFAIHGTRPEAVTWIAGRFDLLATFFALAGLVAFLRYYRTQSKLTLFGSLLCMGAGMFSKESAYVFPLLLMLILFGQRDLSRKSLQLILPYCVLALFLFAYRWRLLGGVGGYRDTTTGSPEVLHLGLLSSLKAILLRLWAALCFPLNWSVEPGWVLAVLLMLNVAGLILASTTSVRHSRVLPALGFVILSALPALSQLSIGADLQKSRLLYLPSVGFALLLAVSLRDLHPPRIRWLAAAVVLLFQLAALNHNLNIWKEVSFLSQHTCATAASALSPGTQRVVVAGLPGTVRGVYFFANGFDECLQMKLGRSLESVETLRSGDRPKADKETVFLVWDPVTESLVAEQSGVRK